MIALKRIFNTARKAYFQIGPRKILNGLITIGAIIAIGFLAKSLDFEEWANWVNFSDKESAQWYQGKLGYVAAGMVFTAIGGPRQVMAFFAAYFFGLWYGLAVSMAAVVLGCSLTALFARLFEEKITGLVRGKVDVAFSFWRVNPFTTTIILRLLPVGSNFLTNLAAGATGIPLVAFITGSAIGYIPQMAVFSIMGTGVDVGAGWQIGLSIAMFVALTIFGLWVYGKFRQKIKSRRKAAAA